MNTSSVYQTTTHANLPLSQGQSTWLGSDSEATTRARTVHAPFDAVSTSQICLLSTTRIRFQLGQLDNDHKQHPPRIVLPYPARAGGTLWPVRRQPSAGEKTSQQSSADRAPPSRTLAPATLAGQGAAGTGRHGQQSPA
ncbi:hypothetical protein ACP70R_043970 [Stipagrostis hirtigluma subsp. patula]